MHSSSQMLKKLLCDTFNGVNFHNYLINEEAPVVYKIKSMAQSLVKNLNSFKSISLSNASMNFSIKDTKQSFNLG